MEERAGEDNEVSALCGWCYSLLSKA
jgi:hypothetical protein